MLKFFRQYQGIILGVGISLLMVAFLIQPTLSMFQPDPGKQPVGTIGGREITLGDLRAAKGEIGVLDSITPLLVQSVGGDELRWTLMLHEARAMGLAASDFEVSSLIRDMGLSDEDIRQKAERAGTNTAFVRQALGNWLVVQQYQELMLGVGHVPVSERLGRLITASQFARQPETMQFALMMLEMSQGQPRVSPPLVRRFAFDQGASVRITAVAIPAERHLDKVPAPTPERLAELFEAHKDKVAGADGSAPGYRFPDRVRIEWLTIPFDQVRATVQVEEADAYEYYEANKDRFRTQAPDLGDAFIKAPSVQQSYEEARGQVIDILRDQRANELADRMVKAAQAMLLEQARPFKDEDGYKVVPAEFEPTALSAVAVRLQEQFGVLASVTRRNDDWLTVEQLGELPGLGGSGVVLGMGPGNQPRMAPFSAYVMSAREIAGENNPLASLRLQAKMPSQPLLSFDDGRHLFRLIDAQRARTPESLDEVRPQVERDARRLAAYEQLKLEAASLLEKARAGGFDPLAAEMSLSVLTPPPFAKRQSGFGGMAEAPLVPGIGRDAAFVDRVFELAQSAGVGGVDAIPVESSLSLVLVRVEEFKPITKAALAGELSSPMLAFGLQNVLRGKIEPDALSAEKLPERLGFVREDAE